MPIVPFLLEVRVRRGQQFLFNTETAAITKSGAVYILRQRLTCLFRRVALRTDNKRYLTCRQPFGTRRVPIPCHTLFRLWPYRL